jgi:hypothetical protein
MTDVLAIPDFLKREKNTATKRQRKTVKKVKWVAPKKPNKRRLTGVLKETVAIKIGIKIRGGDNTFAKIKKALPEYDDRILKSGLNYGLGRVIITGSVSQMRIYKKSAKVYGVRG